MPKPPREGVKSRGWGADRMERTGAVERGRWCRTWRWPRAGTRVRPVVGRPSHWVGGPRAVIPPDRPVVCQVAEDGRLRNKLSDLVYGNEAEKAGPRRGAGLLALTGWFIDSAALPWMSARLAPVHYASRGTGRPHPFATVGQEATTRDRCRLHPREGRLGNLLVVHRQPFRCRPNGEEATHGMIVPCSPLLDGSMFIT